jgi:hypothetical protein
MASRRMGPILNEIYIKHKVLKQITTFCYFGYSMRYEIKIKIPRIMNRVSRPPLLSRHTSIWSYEANARPTLPCDSEPWTVELDYYVMAQTCAKRGGEGEPGQRSKPVMSNSKAEISCQQRTELCTPRICCKRIRTYSSRPDTTLAFRACAITL